MAGTASFVRGENKLAAFNRAFYDGLWSDARLIAPQRFNTWPLVTELVAGAGACLEVAPGLRPRLPLEDTQFLDISVAAMARLHARGARAAVGLVSAMPFAASAFDFVCAFDIVEHVEDDAAALAELARVTAPGAPFLLSVPLHESAWTPFDDFVGHRRRYEPRNLEAKLARYGFRVERSAVYGMQPKSSRVLDWGMWCLTHQRERAMWWYNHVFMPIGLRLQKPLKFTDGLIDRGDVDTVLIVCRKDAYKDETASDPQGTVAQVV
ncbi:MAG: methyltransferase domain-containing protein [Gammaproteobacteria bacterium]